MIRIDKTIYLELEDFQLLVNQLREARDIYSEDMPPFSTRYEGRLESIISQVQGNYFGTELYPGLEEKASRLFYSIIKNHPFLNGNKRIAVVSLLVFLSLNTDRLYFDKETINNELFELSIATAASLPDELEEIISLLKSKIHQYIFL